MHLFWLCMYSRYWQGHPFPPVSLLHRRFVVFHYPWYVLSDKLHLIHSKPDCSDQHSFVIDPVYVLKGLRDFVTKLSAKQYRSECAISGKYLLLGDMEERTHRIPVCWNSLPLCGVLQTVE